MVNVAVIGAGIIGLSSDVKIKEKYPDFKVTLISETFTPETTGDGSGGLWFPFLAGNTPESLLLLWGIETYKLYHELWLMGEHDVALMPVYQLHRKPSKRLEAPEWSKQVFGFNQLNKKELKRISELYSAEFVEGQYFTTFVVSPRTLLAYLQSRFETAGGIIQRCRIRSLSDSTLKEHHIIVNCSGLGARELVPDDGVHSIRGQIAKVKADWINETIIDEDGDNYVIPNLGYTVLGGTHQTNDYRTNIDEEDTDHIINGCKKLYPGLKYAETIENWAGLRPGRDVIRVDSQVLGGKHVIHNYGHGGSGLTLFWGCASQVLQLLEERLSKQILLSKL